MVKWIIVAVLLLPVAEIATFVVVGLVIGFGWALVLSLVTSIAGFLVLQQAGRGRLAGFRNTVAKDGLAPVPGAFLSFWPVSCCSCPGS